GEAVEVGGGAGAGEVDDVNVERLVEPPSQGVHDRAQVGERRAGVEVVDRRDLNRGPAGVVVVRRVGEDRPVNVGVGAVGGVVDGADGRVKHAARPVVAVVEVQGAGQQPALLERLAGR